MNAHFVCRGNTYRSRLAEAYFNSRKIPNWTAVSSGIEATQNLNGAITTYAERIIAQNHLEDFGKATWTQSTRKNLEESDVVIFLNGDVYNDCVRTISPDLKNYFVWDIEDVDVVLPDDEAMQKITEETFARIVARIHELMKVLEKDQ